MFPYRAENLSRLIADNRLLEHARLLDQEVRLAAKIADLTLIDKETVEEVIVVAKKLAAAGSPLRLVDNDDILDIAQLFATRTAGNSFNLTNIIALSPRPTTGALIPNDLDIPRKPTASDAKYLLRLFDAHLHIGTGKLKLTSWTARVAAVLAYFSALE